MCKACEKRFYCDCGTLCARNKSALALANEINEELEAIEQSPKPRCRLPTTDKFDWRGVKVTND